ncbi:DNA polymerase III subunit alpha [Streptomyces sp. NPDC048281]|uniref:DNA polymerase III subunit alpha n=1 Tax=Streptomyces sp. NPDC048281 TaxID=3154715 RepID=UPI00343A5BD3
MLRLITSYAHERFPGTEYRVGNLSIHVPALVEHEEDGTRWLVVAAIPPITVRPQVWRAALNEGAAGVMEALQDGVVATPTHLVHEQDLGDGSICLAYSTSAIFGDDEGIPTYHQVLDQLEAKLSPPHAGLPKAASGFVHLHTHSEYSPLDGLSRMDEILREVAAHGQTAVAITDHGTCAGHPELQRAADKAGVKPIFGIEANLTDDRLLRGETVVEGDPRFCGFTKTVVNEEGESKDVPISHARMLQNHYWHLCLFAMDDTGLRNIWAASTESFRDGFYGRPRMDWDTLARFSEGVIASTGCLRGPVAVAIKAGDMELARQRLTRLMDIYPGRLYVELQPNDIHDQRWINTQMIVLAKEFGLPLIATVDSHFPTADDAHAHDVWIACQTQKDVQDEGDIFSEHLDLFVMGEDQVRAGLATHLVDEIIDEAIANTAALAERCNARIEGETATPSFTGDPAEDERRLRELCEKNWERLPADQQGASETYRDRYRREMDLLKDKGFTGYYLMVADYCLDSSTPVLTEDLRWVEVGKLEVGDKLAGFDEHKVLKDQKSHRYWRSAEVVNTRRITLPTYKIVLADGTETIASEDHKWLVSSPGGATIRWVRTKDLRVGQRAQRLVPEWDTPNTWEAGYIAGILDGEGCLLMSKVNNGGRSLRLSFAQKEGVVLDTSLRILNSWGFDCSVRNNGPKRNGLRSVEIRGGRAEIMRLLGMVRPQRLLAKLDVALLGRVTAIDSPAVVSIEPLGLGEVVALETTTGTLVAQGFAHHNCGWAKDNGILVGPGRGSGGGSLVAYLARITSLDPIRHDLLFERFLTRGRAGLPDFDVDFPASKKAEILGYLRQRWGAEHVVTIGSEGRLKNKAVLDNLLRALKSQLPEHAEADLKAVKELIKEAEAGTAGLGLSWEDLWVQHGEQLQPYADRYPLLFSMAEKLVGRLKSYGRHAAGVVISTGAPLTSWLPMRSVDGEEQMVTQWAMGDVEAIGLVKFDILTLSTLDTIQGCLDLVHDQRAHDIDLEAWEDEFEDPLVWDELQAAHTLGVFQIETNSGTRLCERMRPKNVAELADMVTIVRPGPMNSGLTDLYLRRRAGEQAVTYPDPRLEKVLAPTFGAMIYQEQVMAVTRLLAGYDESEADGVRRILGKKKVSAIADAGQEFLSRVDMPREQAERLWSQMAEFSKYGFNKSHAYAYAFLAYWTAFLKVNYPREFLTSVMSVLSADDKDRVPEFVKEARRLDIEVLPPDINASGAGFRPDPASYALRYGLDSVKGVGAAAVADIQVGQPFTTWEDYEARRGPKANAGVTALLARVGAFDSLVPNRRGLEAKLLAAKTKEDARCVHKIEVFEPDVLPCGFDWSTEPAPVNKRTGKILKRKPLPKRCTRACRQYTAPPPLQIETVEPYSPVDIRTIEHEMLGIHLSSTPFDDLSEHDRTVLRAQAEQMATGPNGTYYVAAIVAGARPHTARSGDQMGFLNLETEISNLRVAVYRDAWAVEQRRFTKGALCLAELKKTDRGYSLVTYQPL